MAKVGEYGLDDAHLDGAAPRTPHSRPPAGLGPERVHPGIVRQPGARSLVVRALHAPAQDREERALPGQHPRLGHRVRSENARPIWHQVGVENHYGQFRGAVPFDGSYAAANRPTGFGRMAAYGPSSEANPM